jgi:site-specific DNA recombinase
MRAALYARYSTDMQSAASIDDQLRVCARLAERHGFAVAAQFSDAAISGGTATRPGYQSMLAAARRHEFDVIVAEDTSRLWRNLAEQAPRLAELADLGVHVVTHDLDTRNESAGMLGAVLGASSEAYRKEIGRRVRRGLEGLARNGKPTGGRAYGYISAAASGTGQVEIDQEQAAIVRRVFELYADGASPRTIAAQLNAEGAPSPGSSWQRDSRRTSKWLLSAIWGNPTRGLGILNNELYIGRSVWNRFRWVRSAADSSKRRCKINPSSEWIVRTDERLRIVSDELWQRVKVRQKLRSETVGARIRGALTRRAPGGGRTARYLLSGMLRCGICDATFTLANADRYQCASHVNGRACSNTLSVRRSLVEARILDSVRADLQDGRLVAEVERRFRHVMKARRAPKIDTARVTELQREIANIADAIAGGLLRSSPALAQRLASAEAELARLETAAKPQASRVARIAPNVAEHYRALVGRLDETLGKDAERSRTALQEAIGPRITLRPDESGGYLWAEFGLEAAPLLRAAVGS